MRREPDDPMALGEVDAPVVMLAYSEFQCPFCGKFARDTEPTLVEKYVDGRHPAHRVARLPLPRARSRAPQPAAVVPRPRRTASGSSTTRCTPTSCRPTAASSTRTTSSAIAEELGLDVEQFRADMTSAADEQAIARGLRRGAGDRRHRHAGVRHQRRAGHRRPAHSRSSSRPSSRPPRTRLVSEVGLLAAFAAGRPGAALTVQRAAAAVVLRLRLREQPRAGRPDAGVLRRPAAHAGPARHRRRRGLVALLRPPAAAHRASPAG